MMFVDLGRFWGVAGLESLTTFAESWKSGPGGLREDYYLQAYAPAAELQHSMIR